MVYPIIHRVSTIQGGAGFLPSTVWPIPHFLKRNDVCRPNDTSPTSVICWMSLEPGWVHLQSTGDAVIETGWNPFAILYNQYIISMVNVLSKNIHSKVHVYFSGSPHHPAGRARSFSSAAGDPVPTQDPGPAVPPIASCNGTAMASTGSSGRAFLEKDVAQLLDEAKNPGPTSRNTEDHRSAENTAICWEWLLMTPLYIPYPLARSFHHL